jgi:voltage-gated potassium channel Kch
VSSISAAVLAAAQAAVTAARPITVETALVMSARNAVSGQTIRVRALPGVKSSYAWDWNDNSGAGYVVSSWSAGAGLGGSDRVTLTSGPDTSLVTAIAAGKPARVQILSTGGPQVPIQLTAVAADTSGHTIDLVTAGTGFVVPTAGDAVYAGSSMVTPIASAILAYIDTLGPSRVSGMADVIQPWDDTIRVAVLERIATRTAPASCPTW